MPCKDILEFSLEELRALDYFLDEIKPFDSVIIVPLDYLHDSGFRCMKYVLCDDVNDEIVGVVGGGSDVIHLDGIGGYGLDFQKTLDTGMTTRTDWSIDCMKCGCLRIFSSAKRLTLRDKLICSSFELYTIPRKGNEL